MTPEAKILTLWSEQAESLISRRQELKRRDRQLYRLITRMHLRQDELAALEADYYPFGEDDSGRPMTIKPNSEFATLLVADHSDVDQIRADFNQFKQQLRKWTADMTRLMQSLRDVINDSSRHADERRFAIGLVNRLYDAVKVAGDYLILSESW